MSDYRLSDPVPSEVEHELLHLSPLTRQLLFARGVTTKGAADSFLSPNYDTDRHDPFLMIDMEKAVERVLSAIKNTERTAIWSDYDCDGIPGGVLLHDFFKSVEFSNFENHIPHRHNEGYGLNRESLDTLIERGATLIITIDCGTTDVEAIAHARSRGADVIVIDHHEIPSVLPDAYALLNPKRGGYPTPYLCGTGVTWKLIEALILRGNFSLTRGQEKWLLDVVGLATIADMVPLSGENRVLAHYGLQVLRKTRRPGLQHLLRKLRVDPRTMGEDDIGFSIAPRINAASRMGKPEDAFLMLTANESDAPAYAEHLDHINNERKGVVASMVKDAKKRLSERESLESVIVIGNPDWRPSLAGLVANSLAEEHKKPTFVWGRDGRDIFKGSCRSDGVTSVVTLMQEAREAFIEFGGHHASGGFSVRPESIHTFSTQLITAYKKIGSIAVGERVEYIDADLTLSDVTAALYREIEKLSPFGEGNRKPVFRFSRVTPKVVSQFGKAKEHLKLEFENGYGSTEAIAFFATPESFKTMPTVGKSVDLIANLEKSYFGGRISLRLRIIDVL